MSDGKKNGQNQVERPVLTTRQGHPVHDNQNLRTIGVDFSIANADLVHPVHQFGDEVKIETGAPKRRDLSLGRENHLRVFNCVIEIVPGHGHRNKLALGCWEFKSDSGNRKS